MDSGLIGSSAYFDFAPDLLLNERGRVALHYLALVHDQVGRGD